MQIIKTKTIKEFIEQNPSTESSLVAFISVLKSAKWGKSLDVIDTFGVERTDTFKNNRVCIDVGGGNIRVVLSNNYYAKSSFVKWIGWHKDYDKIDPATVEFKK